MTKTKLAYMHAGHKRMWHAFCVIGDKWHISLNFCWLFLDVEVSGDTVFLKNKSGSIKSAALHQLTRASTSMISHRPSGMGWAFCCLVVVSFFFPSEIQLVLCRSPSGTLLLLPERRLRRWALLLFPMRRLMHQLWPHEVAD